jgi:two-component system nitrate/nitrite response regulator NarL
MERGRPAAIRVVLVSEIRLYRDGLAQMIETDERFEVVRTLDTCAHALAAVARVPADVVLVDLSANGSRELIRALVARSPEVKVLALGVTESEVIPLAEAGTAGFVTCDASLEDLLSTVERAANGEALCSPRTVALLLQRVAALARERTAAPAAVLTSREREIIALVDRGCSNKEIANQLRIQVATVKNHIHNILEKLSVSRRAEAAALVRGIHLD